MRGFMLFSAQCISIDWIDACGERCGLDVGYERVGSARFMPSSDSRKLVNKALKEKLTYEAQSLNLLKEKVPQLPV